MHPRFSVTVILAVILVVFLIGCGGSKRKLEMQISIGIDNSGSTADALPRYKNYANSLVRRLRGNWVNLYSYAQEPKRHYGEIVKDPKDFTTKGTTDIVKRGLEKKEGTLFKPMLEQFMEDAQCKWQSLDRDFVSDPAKLPTYGVLLTDGLANDPTGTREMAEELGKSDNFKCLFVGPVDPSDSLKVQKTLEGLATRGKLIIAGPNDFQEALDAFLKRVRTLK